MKLFLFLITTTVSFGQGYQFWFPASGFDTNDNSAVAIWDASDLNSPGSRVVAWKSRRNGFQLNSLEDTPSVRQPIYTNSTALRGNGYVIFDGVSNIMRETSINVPQPTTHICVFRYNPNGSWRYIIDSTNSAQRQTVLTMTDGRIDIDAGSGLDTYSKALKTNTWMVCEICFNGASTYIKTNTVEVLRSSAPGTCGLYGLTLGARYTLVGPGKFDLTWYGIYTNLTEQAASNKVTMLRARFGI